MALPSASRIDLADIVTGDEGGYGEGESRGMFTLPQLEWAKCDAQRQFEAAITMEWSKNEKIVKVVMEERRWRGVWR